LIPYFNEVDTITYCESVIATNFSDRIEGDEQNNTFYCLAGNDTVRGMLGNDTMFGGLDYDFLDY